MVAKKKVVKKKIARKKSTSKSLAVSRPESSLPALPVDATPTAQVMHSLMMSMEKGLAPEQLKMVLDAQERILNRQAQQDYQIAMRNVQQAMPAIFRNAERDNIDRNYADLDQIIRTITPVYTAEGFSLSFGTADCPLNRPDETPEFIRITCDVMHVGGWKKSKFTDVAYDMTGPQGTVNKTKTQGGGSANAYGRRYLTALIFNLATSDDDDGSAAGSPQVQELSDQQLADMNTLIDDAKVDMKAFLKFAKSKTVEGIKLKDFDRCVQMLQKKINKTNGVTEL